MDRSAHDVETDLVVAGAGVIGLSVAFEALRRGRRVVLVDPSPGRGAAYVAAGMLAPASEAHFGEEALTRLLLEAATRWPAFAASLEGETGRVVGFRSTPTLVLGFDAADRAEVRRILELQRSLGISVDVLDRGALRTAEPMLAGSLAEAARFPGDHQVDNRALLEALHAAVTTLGGEFVPEVVGRIGVDAAGRGEVITASGTRLVGRHVVVALGASTTDVLGTLGGALAPVRPVKGHVLRLAGAAPLLEATVRGLVRGRPIYLVPRSDGRLVVGATSEERGFDTTVTAGEVHQLLDDARTVLPGIDELELVEAIAGLRPATASNAPTVVRLDGGPLVVATGHYRNGILLAPLTASMVLALLDGDSDRGIDLLAAATGSW